MTKHLSLLGAAALLALAGCAHDDRDTNTAPRPESDTMQSQTNDIGQPFLSSPTFRETRRTASRRRVGRRANIRTGPACRRPTKSNPPNPGAGTPATP